MNAATEHSWIALARSFIGLKETPGPGNTPEVVQFFKDIKRGGIKDDIVPWCSAFVGAMLERSGITSSRYESAMSYADWGMPLPAPEYGCIVVFKRDGGGHVGFVVGRASNGNLLVLGGNQGDAVNIKEFDLDRVVAYRWPAGQKSIAMMPTGSAALSRSEA